MNLSTIILAAVISSLSFSIAAREYKRPKVKEVEVVEELDNAGRRIIRGPVYGGYYARVHIISNSVGIDNDSVSVTNSVIEAPICIRTSGIASSISDNILNCNLCVEFTGTIIMNNSLSGNKCSGKGTNRPDIFDW